MAYNHVPVPQDGAAKPPSLASARRLLYVEDNPQIAEITSIMLEDLGLEIVQAASAEEALRLTDMETDGLETPFALVLTDIVMPGLSGVQLARKLTARWPDLPVVLVSGFSEDLAVGYGSQYELLRKPFTQRNLLDCLDRYLNGPVYQRA